MMRTFMEDEHIRKLSFTALSEFNREEGGKKIRILKH